MPILFALFFLTMISSSWAQTFDESMQKLVAEKEALLEQWRTEKGLDEKTVLPLDKAKEFRDYFSKLEQDYLAKRLKVHDDFCAKDKSHCLSEKQRRTEEAKVRVLVGFVDKKVAWIESNKGASPKQVEVAFREQDQKQESDPCLTKGDCAGRGIASEQKQDAVARLDNSAEKKDIEQGLEKYQSELDKLESDYVEKYPYAESQMNEEALKARKEIEGKKVQMLNNFFNGLCEKYPKSEKFCDPSVRKTFGQDAAKNICLASRQHEYYRTPEMAKRPLVDSEQHRSEWEALTDPKDCQTLINKDKGIEVAAETGAKTERKTDTKAEVETPANEDEQSPRNYKAETCQWVKDIPRKIISGPGCTSKGYSVTCTGYVVCEQKVGGGKFVRMSTCGADKCGENDAAACTGDKNYFSSRPHDESRHFVSPILKKILSSEQ